MFERAVRLPPSKRWHLDYRCGVKGEVTAAHGRSIVAAACRHLLAAMSGET